MGARGGSAMANKAEPTLGFEGLKLCIEDERLAESKFAKYFIASVVLILLTRLAAASQDALQIPGMVPMPSTIITENSSYLTAFIVALMLYAFIEWSISIIDLNRHPLYNQYSCKRSLVALLANKWDAKFSRPLLQCVALLDLIQNLLFLLVFCLLLFLLFQPFHKTTTANMVSPPRVQSQGTVK
jgi:hypothetical protein